MKPSTRYFSRLAPADSISCRYGRRFSSAICCPRRIFSRPIACIAPASIPESLAFTKQRTPLTNPMPVITPAPPTPPSVSSAGAPATVESSSQGAPGSSSRSTRSRGSNCPRRANRACARADAAAVRDSISRSRATSARTPARRSRNDSESVSSREAIIGIARAGSWLFERLGRAREVKPVERRRGARVGIRPPKRPGVARVGHATVDPDAGAGDEGRCFAQ